MPKKSYKRKAYDTAVVDVDVRTRRPAKRRRTAYQTKTTTVRRLPVASKYVPKYPAYTNRYIARTDYRRIKTPRLYSGGAHSTIVKHREYITDLLSSKPASTFGYRPFTINPGDRYTFPWLYGIARNYQQFKFRRLKFEFKTTSSDALNSTNTALGSVIMATQYNVLDEEFENKQAMENFDGAVVTKPSKDLVHYVQVSPGSMPIQELYVRPNEAEITGSDKRLYDVGTFYIATSGIQEAEVRLGEIWVSYEIELLKPRLAPPPAGTTDDSPVDADEGIYSSSWVIPASIPAWTSANFLSRVIPDENNNLDIGVSGGTITFGSLSVGYYLITILLFGDNTSVCNPMHLSCSGNVLLANAISDGVNEAMLPNGNGAYHHTITVAASGSGSLYFTGGQLPTNSRDGALFITRFDLATHGDGLPVVPSRGITSETVLDSIVTTTIPTPIPDYVPPPAPAPVLVTKPLAAHYKLGTGATVSSANNGAGGPFSTATAVDGNINMTLTNLSITFPSGPPARYIILILLFGQGNVAPMSTQGTGALSIFNGFGDVGSVFITTGAGVYQQTVCVEADNGGTISFLGGTLPSNITSGDLWIMGVNMTD